MNKLIHDKITLDLDKITFLDEVAPWPAKKPIMKPRKEQVTKQLNGVRVLDNEAGNRFYYKHMSPKAQAAKKAKRKAARKSRKGK